MKGDDCVVVCKYFVNGSYSIEHYYNLGRFDPVVLYKENPSIGLSSGKFKLEDESLSFNFERLKKYDSIKNYYDLNNNFHLLLAMGELSPNGKGFNIYFIDHV